MSLNSDIDRKTDKSVIIVEDDSISARMLESFLQKYGYRILAIATSGEEAVKKAGDLRPDIVLMDITLSGDYDGIQAASDIYREYDIPFLYLTAGGDDVTFERAKNSYPFGYLLKPYNYEMIFANIEVALHKHETEKKLRFSEKRNKDILSSIPDIMFNMKPDGEFIDQVDADIASMVWNDKVTSAALPYIKKTLKDNEMQTFDYSIMRNNEQRYFEVRLIPSSKERVLTLVRNITEKKKAELELDNYKKNLEILVEQRTKELMSANENLKKEEKEKVEYEQKANIFDFAIMQSPNIFVVVDKTGNIEYINSKFTEISGFSSDQVTGKKIEEPGNRIISEAGMWEMMIKNGSWQGELYNLDSKGEIYYLSAHVSGIKDEKGHITHYIIEASDITEKKKEKMELDKAMEIITRANVDITDKDVDWLEWKEKMMSRNMSRTDKSLFRNINNSFTQGAGFGSLISLFGMLSGSAEKHEERYLVDAGLYDLIMNNINIAQEAFKTFSNIDWIISNDIELQSVSFKEIYELLKASCRKIEGLANIKNQRIVISDFIKQYANVSVNLNKEYFYKAFNEILLNAMKFSKNKTFISVLLYVANKSITVTILSEPDKSDEGVLGIPPEYEKVVFEPFYRLTKYVFEQYKSLDFGVGLTMVEKIMAKHGGEIFANNVMDHSDLKREPQVKVNLTMTFPVAAIKK